MTASPHLIGIGAGVVAAALFASLATNTALAMLLFYLTPLPLFLARLGWGKVAGQLAFVTALALISLIIGLKSAAVYGIVLALPASILAHFALLSRSMVPEDSEGRPLSNLPPVTEWYPPGHVIAWAALIGGGIVALGLLLVGGSAEVYQAAVRTIFQQSILPELQRAGVPIDPARSERFIHMVSRFLLPALTAIAWMFIMLLNLGIAARSAAISGLLPRPWPSFANLEYPPIMTVAFLASVGAALLPGMPGIMAMAFVGAFGFAYLLLGLIVLHQISLDTPLRPVMLVALYVSLILVDWAAIVVAIIGLAEPFLELRQRALRRSAPPPRRGGET
jgi:hypothetical protein